MDAYILYQAVKQLWSEHSNKNSGLISKSNEDMKICVWTDEGYREVVGVSYNTQLKMIELQLDKE
jgi:hypothetical protein